MGYLDRVWFRVACYVLITAVVQIGCGLLLYVTMHSRGPVYLLFLLVTANVAYPWLLQHALAVEFWPYAIVVGTGFMFLLVSALGEVAHSMQKKAWGYVR